MHQNKNLLLRYSILLTLHVYSYIVRAQTYRSRHYYLSTSTTNVGEAESHCNGLGTGITLASIHNPLENDEAYTLCWIGLTDTASEGTFVWNDGTTTDYTNWYPGEVRRLRT